jgi:hypothetical protein
VQRARGRTGQRSGKSQRAERANAGEPEHDAAGMLDLRLRRRPAVAHVRRREGEELLPIIEQVLHVSRHGGEALPRLVSATVPLQPDDVVRRRRVGGVALSHFFQQGALAVGADEVAHGLDPLAELLAVGL